MNQSRCMLHSLLAGQETRMPHSMVSGARPRGLCAPSALYGTVTQYKQPPGQVILPYPQDATSGSRCQSCPAWHCRAGPVVPLDNEPLHAGG